MSNKPKFKCKCGLCRFILWESGWRGQEGFQTPFKPNNKLEENFGPPHD